MNKILILLLLLLAPILVFSQDDPPEVPDGYFNKTTMKISYFLGFIDVVETDFPVPENLKEHKDIVYKTIDSTKLKLDIYHSKNISESAPLLIFIHGGGWHGGDKHDYLRYLVDFAKKGYVTATVQYRFTNKAKFPAQLLDVKAAVKWLKQNAEQYYIDNKNIAVIGGSAGGHLSLMLGYTSDISEFDAEDESLISSKVQAVVDLYGPSDLTTDFARKYSSVRELFNKSYSEDPVSYLKASPFIYITKNDPPTLIFQGTSDETCPVAQSDILNDKLKSTGVPVEYHKLEGFPHTMDLSVEVNEYCQYYMNRFFEKYLHKN